MQICPKCYSDMRLVEKGMTTKFVCENPECRYEDTEWKKIQHSYVDKILDNPK